jgi:uncharacterized protein (DUF983 family)
MTGSVPTGEANSPVSFLKVVAACRCPRCGKGRLFKGLLTVRPVCEVCGLELARHDAGDGPAVFAIFVLGALFVGLAVWVEFRFEPPLWVHLIIWPLLILHATIGAMRPAKAALIALEYRNHSGGIGGGSTKA